MHPITFKKDLVIIYLFTILVDQIFLCPSFLASPNIHSLSLIARSHSELVFCLDNCHLCISKVRNAYITMTMSQKMIAKQELVPAMFAITLCFIISCAHAGDGGTVVAPHIFALAAHAARSDIVTLTNGLVSLTFDNQGGISTFSTRTEKGAAVYDILGDRWSIVVSSPPSLAQRVLGPALCPLQTAKTSASEAVFTYGGGACSPYVVDVTYELQEGWHFATKGILARSEFPEVYIYIWLSV